MFSVSLHLFYSCVKYSVLIYDPLRASTALENVATPLYHDNRRTESKHNTQLLGQKNCHIGKLTEENILFSTETSGN